MVSNPIVCDLQISTVQAQLQNFDIVSTQRLLINCWKFVLQNIGKRNKGNKVFLLQYFEDWGSIFSYNIGKAQLYSHLGFQKRAMYRLILTWAVEEYFSNE